MTQVSLVQRPIVAAPQGLSGGDAAGEPSEDPDSPGPKPRSVPSSVTQAKASASPSADREPLADPLAEPVAALLGTALALLTLTVPLLAVLGEGRGEPSSGSTTPETSRLVVLGPIGSRLGSKRVDHRTPAGGSPRP